MNGAAAGPEPIGAGFTTGRATAGEPGLPGGATPQGSPAADPPSPGRAGDIPGGDHGPPAGQTSVPSITLPKGGGAIRGIGEKFTVNPATGTASLVVPVPASGGRPGAGPSLSLTYDSGAGNGVFGLGWQLGTPAITRKTDKGIPRYDDAEESDVFILSGQEDLVPVLGNGRPHQITRHAHGAHWLVRRYRPRVESQFARIERWTNQASGDIHWRCITRDNVTSVFGTDDDSRVADQEPGSGTRRIFSWLLAETYDDKGNVTRYRYKREDASGVRLSDLHERNRSDWTRTVNRYLKSIRYGNRVSRLAQPEPDAAGQSFMFEVVLDYGDHDPGHPTPAESRPWACRRDPFSTSRAGFEIRTYRLCQRILVFHHFPEEPDVGADCLVRSLDLGYQHGPRQPGDARTGSPLGSYLTSITTKGWRQRPGGGYLTRSIPPLELTYSQAVIDDDVKTLDPGGTGELAPVVDGTGWQWIDLDGEGIPGALGQQAGWWYYKPNLGRGKLAASEPLRSLPTLAGPSGGQRLLDLAGDGRLDLVQLTEPTPGFATRTARRAWAAFTPFRSLPVIDWADPDLRFVDADGDGLADLLITRDDTIEWCRSLGEAGWTRARVVGMPTDEASGPRQVFANGDENVFLADMTGDGLSDIVRIRNGQVCYWPNMGRGRFGRRVEMDEAPVFDQPDLFDPARIRLADVDGSGTTDIVYLGRDIVSVHLNQSGNAWAPARLIRTFPRVDDLANVSVTDLLGTGTACMVWSSPLPGDSARPVRYLDLTGGIKPHLLNRAVNNLGAQTSVSYASSTKFYLRDKVAGDPWITRLPFPVHVVERVETWDGVGRNLFVSRYAYHHGYFDGVEREFRGFGMVEQRDTEDFATLSAAGRPPAGGRKAANLDPAGIMPPVLTRTWFHTGADTEAGPLARRLARGYFDDGRPGMRLPGQQVPAGLSAGERREAWRALKGLIARQEIYAEDGGPRSAVPYTAAQHTYQVRLLQPRGPNRHAAFLVHPRESLTHHYERKTDHPRVQHQLVLAVNDLGDVRLAASIGYGRREPVPGTGDGPEQTRPLATVTGNSYTNLIDEPDAFRGHMIAESRTWELTGLQPPPGRPVSFAQVRRAIRDAAPVPFEQRAAADGLLRKRLIGCQRTVYRADDMSGPLPPGRTGTLALPYVSHQLALTRGLVGEVYGGRVTPQIMQREGGYLRDPADGSWWVPSARLYFAPRPCPAAEELAYARRHFFVARRAVDPFGHTTSVRYDRYDLLPSQTRDAVGNTVTAGERDQAGALVAGGNDYRVLEPALIMDPNRNRSAVAFDALGMVAGTAVMGKPGERAGDSLDGFVADLPAGAIAAYLEDPLASAHQVLGRASTRVVQDLAAWRRTGRDPAVVSTLARETHDADLAPGERTKVQLAFSYSDGFGREIQKKAQAEPGPITDGGPEAARRWIGSGWTILNNKGKPVRAYEPFFSASHRFEFAQATGVSAIVFYDPVGRIVAALYPDHTYGKTVFDAWQQAQWDVTDTILGNPADDPDIGGFARRLPESAYLPTWYQRRRDGALGPDERAAAAKTAAISGTPSVAHFDTLGRTFLTVVRNRYRSDGAVVEEELASRVTLDIDGNRLKVTDPLGRLAARFSYDVLGTAIAQQSMEAGERIMLTDVTGKPIYGWNSRGIVLRTSYDPLRRPAAVHVSDGTGPERLAERAVYGESVPNAEERNLRAAEHRRWDNAGVVTSEAYDFKGNLVSSCRRLASQYREPVDWNRKAKLEERRYRVSTRYDALNRPAEQVLPDATVLRPAYNEGKLLARLTVGLRGAGTHVPMVRRLRYNARGQRTFIEYGNGARSSFSYDPETFRLTRLASAGNAPLQDVRYTYDPAGNVTSVRDHAQQRLFFKNRVAEPGAGYTYDAVYRLIEATGREHVGQLAAGGRAAPAPPGRSDAPRTGLPAPGDGRAMARYTERYSYDKAGNLLRVTHRGADPAQPGWTRRYAYREPSQLEPGQVSNRLSRTRAGQQAAEHYGYDVHGNLTGMTPLPVMGWDYLDRLQVTAPDDLAGGTPERTWYLYDAGGTRVRKTAEAPGPPGGKARRRSERVYIGPLEIHRRYAGDGTTVTLERETVSITDGLQRVALAETRVTGPDKGPAQLIRYQLVNLQASAVIELDELARIISAEEYYPYGSTSYQAVRRKGQAPKRYRFTGRERDEESGLYYNEARYYMPWLGRWCSADPSGLGDSANLYEYVRGNPVRTVDPSGRQGEDPDAGGSAGKAYPACADDMDAGAGDCPSVVGARYPDTVDSVGDPAYTVTEEQRVAEGRPYATAGAADPELAQQGYVLAGPGTKELEWAKEETKVGIAAGTYDATLGTFVEPFLPPGSEARESVQSLRPKTSSPISQYVANGTANVVSTVISAASEGIVSGVTGKGASLEAQAASGGGAPVAEPRFQISVQNGRPVVHLPELNIEIGPSSSVWNDVHPSVLPSPQAVEMSGVTGLANKTWSTTPGGPLTLSGWGQASYIPGYGIPAGDVYRYSLGVGHPQLPHYRDYGRLWGSPVSGSYGASHAERGALFLNPGADSVTVSKLPCEGCQMWLRSEAALRGRVIRVHTPEGSFAYAPNGSVWRIGEPLRVPLR